jgi:pimeloyl-[acyl-carrier protein] methyl ester esterase
LVTLVLLPGLDGTGVLMRPLVAVLPPELAPVVVTYPCDAVLGYDALLPRVLEALPRGRAFVLVGESYGGPLALRAAATRPAGLAGVVLCASFVRSPHPWLPSVARHAVTPGLLRLFPKLSQAKMLLGGYSTPELRALSAEALALVRPEVLAARVREVLAVDVAAELVECPVPVLYLRGTRDGVVPGWNARAIRRIRPTVEVVDLPAPHLVLQTQAAAAAAAIAPFAEECGG